LDLGIERRRLPRASYRFRRTRRNRWFCARNRIATTLQIGETSLSARRHSCFNKPRSYLESSSLPIAVKRCPIRSVVRDVTIEVNVPLDEGSRRKRNGLEPNIRYR